jgi:hypothetical protein
VRLSVYRTPEGRRHRSRCCWRHTADEQNRHKHKVRAEAALATMFRRGAYHRVDPRMCAYIHAWACGRPNALTSIICSFESSLSTPSAAATAPSTAATTAKDLRRHQFE